MKQSTGNQSRRGVMYVMSSGSQPHHILDIDTLIQSHLPPGTPLFRHFAHPSEFLIMSSRKQESCSPTGSANPADAPVIDPQDTYMPPSLARFYMTHLTVTLLHYQGFTSCQAEVIAELEKKVEERKS
jgi:hypothetical protein